MLTIDHELSLLSSSGGVATSTADECSDDDLDGASVDTSTTTADRDEMLDALSVVEEGAFLGLTEGVKVEPL